MKARNLMELTWRNVDHGEPIPLWMDEGAVGLSGGRFAVETHAGTVIAELLDWIVRKPSGAFEVLKAKPCPTSPR